MGEIFLVVAHIISAEISLFVFWGFSGVLQAVTNRNGHTALHLAAMRGHASACPGYLRAVGHWFFSPRKWRAETWKFIITHFEKRKLIFYGTSMTLAKSVSSRSFSGACAPVVSTSALISSSPKGAELLRCEAAVRQNLLEMEDARILRKDWAFKTTVLKTEIQKWRDATWGMTCKRVAFFETFLVRFMAWQLPRWPHLQGLPLSLAMSTEPIPLPLLQGISYGKWYGVALRHDDLARLLNELAALSLEEPESGVAKKVDRHYRLWKLQLAKLRFWHISCQPKASFLHSNVSSIIDASPQFHVAVHGVLTHAVTAGVLPLFRGAAVLALYDDLGPSGHASQEASFW